MEKSANKRWKESGSTLTFKEWIDRENKKSQAFEGSFIPFQGETKLNSLGSDSIKQTIDEAKQSMADAKQDLIDASGYKTTKDNNTVFGLNKGVLIFSGLLIVGSLAYLFYTKSKKK
jgi:hypothetical protein